MLGFAQRLFHGKNSGSEDRDLVVIGSSSTEAFDYVMGRNPKYHPFWASGWTARGLRSPAHREYLGKILADIDRSASIVMNFGGGDVLFSARYKATREGFYDFAGLMQEARDGILQTADFLHGMGFETVTAAFIAPIVSLPQTFWHQKGLDRQLPNQAMARMYYDLSQNVRASMPTFDTFDTMSLGAAGGYFLKPEFRRANADTHPDYIAMQDILWDAMIANLPGPFHRREQRLSALYPHEQILVGGLMPTGQPRKNTCR